MYSWITESITRLRLVALIKPDYEQQGKDYKENYKIVYACKKLLLAGYGYNDVRQ